MKASTNKSDFWKNVDAEAFSGVFSLFSELFYFAKDRDCRFTACNSALVSALGLHFESELLGKTDYELFETRLADAFRTEDQQVMTSGAPVRDAVWHVPDTNGTINWFISTKTPLFNHDQEVVGIAGIMRNGTQAGQALSPYAQLAPVLDYVAAHYAEPIRIPDLAKRAHLSVSQFERRFRDRFNLTPNKYLIKVRLDAASHMLASGDATVSNIALNCGFYDHSHFSRLFTNTFKQSPTAYRKRYR